MKKKLALILSIVLVLAAAVCVFAFTANADGEFDAAAEADAAWKKSTPAAEVVFYNLLTLNAEKNSGSLTELGYPAGNPGTYTFKDGVLTLSNGGAGVKNTAVQIRADGALKIVLDNTDLVASIRNDNVAKAAYPLLLTSGTKGGMYYGTGGNCIRNLGEIFIYGDVGVDLSGGDSLIIDATYPGQRMVIAPGRDSVIQNTGSDYPPIDHRSGSVIFAGSAKILVNGGKAGPALAPNMNYTNPKAGSSIEFRNSVKVTLSSACTQSATPGTLYSDAGSVIVADDAQVVVENRSATAAHANAIYIASSASSDAALIVSDNASLTATAVAGAAFDNRAPVASGKNAMEIDTKGSVKFISTAKIFNRNWANDFAVRLQQGSMAISGDSKVLVSMNLASFGAEGTGTAAAIYVHNNGGDKFDVNAGILLSENAELVVNFKNNLDGARQNGIWMNGANLDVSDNAKFTLYHDQNGKTIGSGWGLIHFKNGTVNVSDNAKALIAELSNATEQLLYFQDTTTDDGYWDAKNGIHVSGGQLELRSPVCVLKEGGMANHRFSGGVVLIHSGNSFPMGADPAADFATNAIYMRSLAGDGIATAPSFDRWGKDWAYFAKGATYSYYDGMAQYAKELGVTPISDASIVDVTYDANGNATSYKYTLPSKQKYKINDNVISLDRNTVLTSATPISIAMVDGTTANATTDGYVVLTETDGSVVYVYDDASDNIASVYTTKNGGTVSYDDKTQNATFNGVSAQSAVIYAPDDDVTVTAVGTNVFTGKFTFEDVTRKGTAVVTGDANASITLNTASRYAFYSSRALIFAGDVSVTVNTSQPDGIHTADNIPVIVKDNAKVTVKSTVENGLRIKGNVEVQGGSLTSTAKNRAINAVGSVIVSGGTVSAYVDKQSGGSYHAILAGKGMTVSGGTVKAYAGSTEAVEVTSGNYTQTGGNVTISTYDDVNYTWKCGGLQVAKGDATISGGTLTVKSSGWAEGTADGEYGGSLAAKNITVSGNAVVKAYSVCTPISGDTHRGARAIRAMSGLTVKDSASVYVEAETAGIDIAAGGLKISDTASVEIKSTFDDSDYAYAQTLVDGTKDGSGNWTWTGAKRGFLRSAGCNMLYVRAGGVTVSGGSLKVSGTSESVAQIAGGITISGGSMTVNGATELIPNAKWTEVGPSGDTTKYLVSSFDGNNFSGVNSIRLGSGNLTVSGGSLNVTGRIRALYVENGTVNLTGGTVTVTGSSSDALQCNNGKITVDGGSLVANGGTRAIYAVKGFDVKNGSVTATTTGNDAVRVDSEGLKISGGTVKATAGSVSSSSRALYAKNTNITVSGGTVNAIAGWSTIYAENGSITISGGSVTAEGDSNIVQNTGTGGITVSGGSLKSTANGTECAIRATKYEQSNGEVTLKAPLNVLDANRNTGADGNLTVSGGILRSTATIGKALDGNVITVSGDAQVYASSPANNNYEGVVQAVTYNQEGGTVDIVSDKTANTKTLVLLLVGTANLNGGTLYLTDKEPTSNPATYAMWSNSGNINLNGTDVFVDLSSNTQKGWAVCAIKIQNKNSIVMNDGTLAVVGGDRTCVFRADSDGSAVTLKGGEVIGYVGSFIGHQPGDGATSSFSINDKAKIDLYYTKSVVLKGNGNMTATGVDANIWAKNAGWTSGSKWLTTGNWDSKDLLNVLLETKNGPFVLSMNGNRHYPESGTPAMVLSADGTLFVLDADSVADGEIYRIDAKGDLKLNVPADKTVNIGSTSYGDVLRAIGNLTVTGKGTLNLTSANSGLVALGDININGGITVNINGGNNAIGTSGGGIYFEDCKVVVNETKKNADFVICSTATDDSSIVFGKGADVTVYGNRSLILRNKGASGSEIRFEDGSKVTAVSTGGYIVYNQGDGGTCEIIFNGGEHSFTTTAEDTASDWWDGYAIRNNKGGVTINGGSITASCTRSPIYATGAVVLKAGTVDLKATKTYGIEAPSVTVNGGTLKVDSEGTALLTKSYKQTAGTVEISSKAGDAINMSGASYVVNADKSITASAVPLTFEVSGGKFTAVVASAGIRMHASWKPTADQAAAAGIAAQDYHAPTTLTFKVSGGEVDLKAGGQVIYLQGGNTASTGIFEISGGKLKAENTATYPVLQFQCKEGSAISFSGNADVDLIASNEANERDTLEVNTATPITISDNADVSVSATGGNAVNLRLGTLTLKDNAKLTAVNTAMTKKTWAESAALWVAGLSISDKAVLNVENTTNCAGPVLGIAIEGNTGKTTVNPVFAGGTVNVKVNDNSTTLGDKWEHRVFGIWISFPETDVTLKGTAFDIALNSAAKNNTASAGFYVQNVPTGFDFNVTGGSIKFEAKQQEALFRSENPKDQATGFNISGGTITGVGYQFWTGFDGQVFTVTGEPTIDYQNLSGKARTGGKSVDDKGVSFLSGKAFRDNGAYIKTGVDPVVPGNPPTSDLVLTSVIVTASVAVVAAIVIVILRRRASRESLED